ncbi:MAG: AtpZ/AtpI family protein [Actinomycetota bacterium]|nr:AtpZ/AtpI family protein [Actinomycetota bacterium]
MLQSDDDRWPMWDTRHASDGEPEKSSKAVDKKQNERALADKKISTNEKNKADTPKSSFRDAMRFASLGTELFAAVLAGMLIAWAISWFVSLFTGYKSTWIIVIGVFLGAAAGFLNMYRVIVEEEQKEQKEERERRGFSK